MPSFCRPWQEGGVGFDYRLNMAIADKWIDTMKTKNDFQWDMGNICHTLTNRRWGGDTSRPSFTFSIDITDITINIAIVFCLR